MFAPRLRLQCVQRLRRACRFALAHTSHMQADLLITRGKAEAEQKEASELAV